MRRTLVAGALVAALACGRDAGGGEPPPVRPFEAETPGVAATPLDLLVTAAQKKAGVTAANPCSDEVFLRRVFLDVIGTLPEPAEVRAFLADRRANRRALLVDALLVRDEYSDYWAMNWADVLRVKSEFPINLWPNAAQAYHRWIRDALRANMPYDKFARTLLTASGSNFREPPANFWRAVQGRTPDALASAVALTFMGTRLETWPEARRACFARFFSRVAYKKTAEWKEEIVLLDPAPAEPLETFLPDGTAVRVEPDDDPRRAFADWLVKPDNPWFARAAVNRVWAWLFGRGIVQEPDDIRPDNPPSIPEALSYLEREFADARWDLRQLLRIILNSRTYQQSPIPRSDSRAAAALFASYPVRRVDAEVLVDMLSWVSGRGEGYTSNTPEPWTFIPEDRRTITLPDGSITSPLLEMFGRPARDTGLMNERSADPTDAQALHLLNSSDVIRRIELSPKLRAVWVAARRDLDEGIRGVYVLLLSREPLDREIEAARAYYRAPDRPARESAVDLAWALISSKEFFFRH